MKVVYRALYIIVKFHSLMKLSFVMTLTMRKRSYLQVSLSLLRTHSVCLFDPIEQKNK